LHHGHGALFAGRKLLQDGQSIVLPFLFFFIDACHDYSPITLAPPSPTVKNLTPLWGKMARVIQARLLGGFAMWLF
jgi:hypothetical protein